MSLLVPPYPLVDSLPAPELVHELWGNQSEPFTNRPSAPMRASTETPAFSGTRTKDRLVIVSFSTSGLERDLIGPKDSATLRAAVF